MSAQARKVKRTRARRSASDLTPKEQAKLQSRVNANFRKSSSTNVFGEHTTNPARLNADAWENVITGLGLQSRDKRLGAQIKVPRSTNEFQLFENLYHGDDLAATIVNTIAQEMIRQWITIQNDDDQEDQGDMPKDFSDQSISQLGQMGADQYMKQGQGLGLASKNIAPSTTRPIEHAPVPNIKKDEALGLHPGPDDSAETSIDQQEADEKKLIGKKTLQKLETIEAQTKVFEALVWARVFGGSLLFLGINDGVGDDPTALAEPLDEENIESFDFLSVFDRWDVDVYTWYRDPRHPKFGLPESYRIRQTSSPGGTDASLSGDIIHETRVIRFGGEMVNRRRRLRNAGWDDSVYIRISDVIRDFAMAWGGVAHLLQDFAQAVFKMQGLANALLSDQDELVLNRMKLMDMARGVSRAVPIDAETEEFERKETPVSGMADLLDRFALRLSAASRIPVCLLMGQSPAGLNATGDSDIRFFYDYIKSQQEKTLRPRLNRILYLLFKSKNGPTKGTPPKNWSLKFNPLWQSTEVDQSTIRLTTAQADQIYFNIGALTPHEIAQSRFGGDAYSTETVLDTDQRMRDAAMQQKLNEAEPETPEPEPGGTGSTVPEQDPAPTTGANKERV